jgi:hypothetical protein
MLKFVLLVVFVFVLLATDNVYAQDTQARTDALVAALTKTK